MKSERNRYFILIVLLFGLLMLSFQNCSKTQFTEASSGLSDSNNTGANVPVITAPEGYIGRSINFTISDQPNPNVDILFIMDNSGSMTQEQTKVANAFSTFLSHINHLNFRVAITTTDNASDVTCKKGNLCRAEHQSDGAFFIDNTTPNANQVFMNTINVGTNGSGHEKAFDSIYNFVAHKKQGYTQFMRSDASLVTIIVSDSDQYSSQTAESFLSDLNTKLDANKSYTNYSSIVLPGDTACRSTGENYGPKYQKLSQLTSGFSVSICEENYAEQFSQIARSITQDEKVLDCFPADTNNDGTPDVTVTGPNGSLITAFTVSSKTVRFNPALSVAGAYRIDYFCAP